MSPGDVLRIAPDTLDYACGRNGREAQVTLADGTKVSLVQLAFEEGETRRWTRTDTYIFGVKDGPEDQGWAFDAERNPSDHEAGADGFRDHAASDGYCVGRPVKRLAKLVEVITWVPADGQ